MAVNTKVPREYPVAQILDVHDGDTWRVWIDLGMDGTWKKAWIRLRGVRAQELGKPGGPEQQVIAADVVKAHAPDGWVKVTTFWTPGTLREIKEIMTFVRYEGLISTHSGIVLNEIVASLIPNDEGM